MKSSSGKGNSGGDCEIGFEVSQGGGDADSTNVELLKEVQDRCLYPKFVNENEKEEWGVT